MNIQIEEYKLQFNCCFENLLNFIKGNLFWICYSSLEKKIYPETRQISKISLHNIRFFPLEKAFYSCCI